MYRCKWCGAICQDENQLDLHEQIHIDLDFIHGIQRDQTQLDDMCSLNQAEYEATQQLHLIYLLTDDINIF
ncbi:hypothetical protein ACF0H5_002222 [Mactra antiquata]